MFGFDDTTTNTAGPSLTAENTTQDPSSASLPTNTTTPEVNSQVSPTAAINSPVIVAPSADTPATPSDSTVPPLPAESTAPDPTLTPPNILTYPITAAHTTDTSAATIASNDLLTIKQDALQSLAPLIDHIDQSPEEHFKTLMMMIQASDNDSLIRQAYDAAMKITDEKIKAQALLDVINEINYFTQKTQQS